MRLKAGILTLLILLLGAAPAAAWGPFAPGSPGLGDPFFPLAGNGGYDVKHYSLALDYDPAAKFLDGEATIVARATQNLSRFNLDLREFAITRLTVNGLRATFTREGQELVITPRLKLIRGFPFVVRVEYAGEPKPVIDPDGSTEGWVPTADGAFVVGEPQGSPSWFPVNDNPRDKATYDMALTVPKGNVALGNGVLLWRRTHGNETTWRWLERNPMASYLATATNGVFELDVERGPRGLPIYNAVDPALDSPELDALLAKQPQMIEFFTSIYGPYPFDAYGAIVDQGGVGYALESQTKPNYDGAPDESTVVHELAHQWLGNSVTLTVWPDIWLNEGFAAWSEWIWSERTGGPSAAEIFDDLYSTPATTTAFWTPPPGDPGGPERLFDGTIYNRGGMTLQALREKVGDEVFFRILRAWCDENHDGNVTTADFIALAERESGQQLDDFFQIWLFTPAKPETW